MPSSIVLRVRLRVPLRCERERRHGQWPPSCTYSFTFPYTRQPPARVKRLLGRTCRPYSYPRPSHSGKAIPAGHGLRILGGDAFNQGTVGGFAIAGIAGDHAVLVQEVPVLLLAFKSASHFRFSVSSFPLYGQEIRGITAGEGGQLDRLLGSLPDTYLRNPAEHAVTKLKASTHQPIDCGRQVGSDIVGFNICPRITVFLK